MTTAAAAATKTASTTTLLLPQLLLIGVVMEDDGLSSSLFTCLPAVPSIQLQTECSSGAVVQAGLQDFKILMCFEIRLRNE